MAENRKMFKNMIERSDISGECVPVMPLIEIVGHCRVLVENHLGVCAYSREKIHIKVRDGIICVNGECLELAKMNRNQIVITGRISSVIIDN